MTLDALRAAAIGVQFNLSGVAATVTTPNGDPFTTHAIWLKAVADSQPYGTDIIRFDPRVVMVFQRTESFQACPRGTNVLAPEAQGGTPVNWTVDGYAESMDDPFLMRVIVKRAAS